jgi:LPS-assembly lipoprotein
MLLTFLLQACGFRPLYAKKEVRTTGYGWQEQEKTSYSFVKQELAKIFIEPVEERIGQTLRIELQDLINTKGSPEKAKYKLSIEIEEPTISQQGIQSDDTATRETMFYKAYYTLYEKSNIILKGMSRTEVGYNLLENPYSTISSVKAAKKRAGKTLANDIALRLGVYFDMIEKDKAEKR